MLVNYYNAVDGSRDGVLAIWLMPFWVDEVQLYPAKFTIQERDLGFKLPSTHSEVAKAKIRQLLFKEQGRSPTGSRIRPRLTEVMPFSCRRPLLLHCIYSPPQPKIKAGVTVYMSEGSNGRTLVARVCSVESADYSDPPFREYGDQWQAYMFNRNSALPALVFK